MELAKLKTGPDKRLAFKIQLNFQNRVLETKCDKSFFYMSSGGKIRPADELVENLIKVINWTKHICNTPFEEPTDIPLLLSKSQLNKQNAKFCEKTKEQKERDLQPPPCRKHRSMTKRKKTNKKQRKSKKSKFTTNSGDLVSSCPKDLLGKMIQHFTYSEESAELLWVKGSVLRICGGSPSNPKFVVLSVDLGNICISNLYEDYKNGDVKLCEVLVEDFIDSTINHLYIDNGEETWWGGEVFDVDIDSEDMENPDFFVTYVNYSSSQEDENEWFSVPLFEDYLKGWVPFLDIHVD